MFSERVLCAGFGGQGVMSIGQLLAYAGMIEDRQVTWIPSYGPEMRGGTAYCSVVISDHEIGSPIVTTNADSAIIMNLPSLHKFESSVKPGGNILLNSSLIDCKVKRSDLNAHYVAAGELANHCGNQQAANIVILGAYIALAAPVCFDSIIQSLSKVFGKKSEKFMALNREALHLGAEAILGPPKLLAAA